MRQFLDTKVDVALPLPVRLEALVDAVVSEQGFGLNYAGKTRTAADTFAERNGNCLAFTNMLVAMARYTGIDAHFQEVDVPPVWEMEGDTLVVNRHVNVIVQDVPDGTIRMRTATRRHQPSGRVIDFNIGEYRSFYRSRVISDARAYAHFHSNLGVEELQKGVYSLALAHFRKALQYDASFAPAWTNIGVLYSRSGKLAEAESAYRQSLRVDDNVSTKHNLAALLTRAGKLEEANSLRAEVQSYRHRNPYLRYQEGLSDFEHGDVAAAEANLRYAISKMPQEHTFHLALGIVLLSQKQNEEAEFHLLQALQLAENPEIRQRYSEKMRLLGLNRSVNPAQ